MTKLYPKCLQDNREYGNTSTGYILPCCWLDIPDLFNDNDLALFVDEKFRLDIVNSIDDIIESKEWADFYSNLKNDIGPKQCHKICGSPNTIHEIE